MYATASMLQCHTAINQLYLYNIILCSYGLTFLRLIFSQILCTTAACIMVCACMNLTLTEEQGLVHAYSYIEVIQQYRSIGFEDPHLHVYSWLALSNTHESTSKVTTQTSYRKKLNVRIHCLSFHLMSIPRHLGKIPLTYKYRKANKFIIKTASL